MAAAAALSLDIPPLKTALPIADQSVTVIASGHVSMAPTAGGQVVAVKLAVDLSDLQEKITAILRAQLTQDNRCGDRLSVERAELAPEAPAALLTAWVRYEKWGCAKAFGKEMVKRLVGGNGVVKVRLTPAVDSPDAVHLHADVLSIDADGQLGEVLRSGSFGAALQEKIRKTLASDLERSTNLRAALPPAVREIASIKAAEFAAAPERRLGLMVSGEVQVSADQAAAISGQLRNLAR
jgi:hypothetical protein